MCFLLVILNIKEVEVENVRSGKWEGESQVLRGTYFFGVEMEFFFAAGENHLAF